MGRPKRVDFPGALHHVVNRGVQKTTIFHSSDEREVFLSLFDRYASDYGMEILAYCMMRNHFHLIVRSRAGRLSDWMQVHQFAYAKRFNDRHELSGHLFQDRFYSELIQEGRYFQAAVAYVLTNPHRSGLAGPETVFHPWTSTRELMDETKRVQWATLFDLFENVEPKSFRDYLERSIHDIEDRVENERRSVRNVQVLGDDAFLEQCLEKIKEETRGESTDREAITPERLLESVCDWWELEGPEELLSSRGDYKHSRPRHTSFYLLHARAHLSMREIGNLFEISSSAVSQGIRKAKSLAEEEDMLPFLEQWDL